MKTGSVVTPRATWRLLTGFVLVTALMTLPTLIGSQRPELLRVGAALAVLCSAGGVFLEGTDCRARWWVVPIEALAILLTGLSLEVPDAAKGLLFAMVGRRGVCSNSRIGVGVSVGAHSAAFGIAFFVVQEVFHDERVTYLQTLVSVPSLVVIPVAMRLLVEGLVAIAAAERTMAAAQDQLRDQALHDALTGLANRTLFAETTTAALSAARGTERQTSVLLLDLDAFKTINDTLGHATGDALLVKVAARLGESLNPGSTLARLGGDEFAILLRDSGTIEAVGVAERVIAAFDRPIRLVTDSGQPADQGADPAVVTTQVRVSVSLGAVITNGHGTADASALLRAADLAMYAAKRAGGNRWAMFEPAMQDQLRERVFLETALRAAVANGDLALHYQPCVDLASGEISSVEALLRWTDPGHAAVSPQRFIPIAEDTGMIVPIGRWALTEACRQAITWELQTGRALSIAVNLSVRQLTDPSLTADLKAALHDTGLSPARLVIELTESELADHTVLPVLDQLKTIGVRLALDDFGTGYSALAYLRRFPLDILKIDQAFVAPITTDPTAAALTRAIIQMAHTLGLTTVAEGVETPEQAKLLGELRCQFAQGYFFAPPSPADDIAGLLHRPFPRPTGEPDSPRA